MPTNPVTPAHLGLILHRMLVDIRALSFGAINVAQDNVLSSFEEINEMADFAEIIPLQFINRDSEWLDQIVGGVRSMAAKDSRWLRYAAVLDMTEVEVIQTLKPNYDHDWGADMQPPKKAAS